MRLPLWFAPNPAVRIRKRSTFSRRSVGRFDRTLHRLFIGNLQDSRFVFDAVDEQDPVEMVDLMLEDARPPAAGLEAYWTVVEPHPLDRHHFGARHLAGPTRDAQAAFITENSAARLDNLGVDQRNRELWAALVVEVLRYMHPDQSTQYPDLRRRQPDARRGQHRLVHIFGQAAQAVVHISDAQRLLPQPRVTFEQNFEKRHESSELHSVSYDGINQFRRVSASAGRRLNCRPRKSGGG